MMRRYGYTRLGVLRKKPQPRPPDPESLPAMQARMVRAVPWLSISEWLLELEARFENMAKGAIPANIEYNREMVAETKARSFSQRRFVPSSWYLKPLFKDFDAEDDKRKIPQYSENCYERELRRLESGYYETNYHKARRDAADTLSGAMMAFARRAALKMISKGCEDPTKVSGDIHYTGHHLIATIFFTSKDNRPFRLTCKTKTNYRYGENAANGRLTIYLQYPFKVVEGPFTIEQG